MVLALIPIAGAIICEDTLLDGTNCTMLTPTLDCSGNYTIHNESGTEIKNSNMTLLNDTIYYFEFEESLGSYIVTLCDNSTREIIVEGEDNMLIYFGILLVFIFFIGLVVMALYYANPIWLKTCIAMGLSILVMSLTRFMSWFVSINHPSELELINTLDHFYMFAVWGFRVVTIAAVFILLIIIVNSIRDYKREKWRDSWTEWGK